MKLIATPRNLIMPPAAHTDTTIDLMWDKPDHFRQKGNFKVYDLLPNTAYTFAVAAVNLDGVESNFSTTSIQSAIDACAQGGVVRVPPGIFVTGALFLKSDMTLWMEEGSKLVGFTDFDNTTEEIAKHYPLIH
ncbi:MAG: hypothetical protein JWN30_1628, partial [Bacilli bacterium]|nr:hypothetical protein [Bacilli bacterium]